ncbi:four-helix bundle copper-binding protein [Streptomyces sp. NPDC006274]|uniref:four-helix bundle copper-binding protein n=1 Tax=unclassified Streptomyces TaxID=2593676 RepID=UPI0033A2C625
MATTTSVKDMLNTYPADLGDVDREALSRCIEECVACAQACTACADACLSEGMVGDLTKCIRTDMDCADICTATAAVLSRHTGYDANITRAIVQACATACKACADECARHADMHEHCRICAEACRSCEQACNDLLATLG